MDAFIENIKQAIRLTISVNIVSLVMFMVDVFFTWFVCDLPLASSPYCPLNSKLLTVLFSYSSFQFRLLWKKTMILLFRNIYYTSAGLSFVLIVSIKQVWSLYFFISHSCD